VDLNLQFDLSIRLLIAAFLGGLIGAERELHEHPAGMRTHLLVAAGCALFTELSIYGFTSGPAGTAAVDPSRIAAQIVTGIGFLGAGAILKYGTSIRGLTTAASLWTTAAVGIAAGTGQWILAIVGTVIVLFSLWPLSRVATALRMRNGQTLRVRALVTRLYSL
jgi:putative Mg2+ transporter-C (MgtC) family protein